jgi:archaellum component FlaC
MLKTLTNAKALWVFALVWLTVILGLMPPRTNAQDSLYCNKPPILCLEEYVANLLKDVGALKTTIDAQKQTIQALQQEMDALKTTLNAQQRQLQAQQQQLQAQQQEMGALKTTLGTQTQTTQAQQQQMGELKTTLNAQQQQLQVQQQQYQAQQEQLGTLNTTLDAQQNKINELVHAGFRYKDNGNGTITDKRSGLIWLKNANCFGAQNWEKAKQSAATLASGQCGLRDGSGAGEWRLPTKEELKAMVDKRYKMPALSNAKGTAQWKEGDVFSDVQSGYWSSATHVGTRSYAWYANLNDGYVGADIKTGNNNVWPVRENP